MFLAEDSMIWIGIGIGLIVGIVGTCIALWYLDSHVWNH